MDISPLDQQGKLYPTLEAQCEDVLVSLTSEDVMGYINSMAGIFDILEDQKTRAELVSTIFDEVNKWIGLNAQNLNVIPVLNLALEKFGGYWTFNSNEVL